MLLMSSFSSILLAAALASSEASLDASSHDPRGLAQASASAITVSHEECSPHELYEPMEAAATLRHRQEFAAALVCDTRAYGACVERLQSGRIGGDVCNHIADLIGDDLGLRAGDLLTELYEANGSADEERFLAALHAARSFVTTLSAELDRTDGEIVPPRVIEALATIDEQVEKLAKDHEYQLDSAEKELSPMEPRRVPASLPGAGPTPKPEPEPTPKPEPEPTPKPLRPDQRRASALIGTGVGALALGTGSMVAGLAQWRISNREVPAIHPTALEAMEQHLPSIRTSIAFISIGTGALVAGAALTTWGATLQRNLGRSRWSHEPGRSLSLAPTVGRAGTGLLLRVRF